MRSSTKLLLLVVATALSSTIQIPNDRAEAIMLTGKSPAPVAPQKPNQRPSVLKQQADADQLRQQGNEAYAASQFDQAFRAWGQARDLYRQADNYLAERDVLIQSGDAYVQLIKPDPHFGRYPALVDQYRNGAINTYQWALAIDQRLGNRAAEAQTRQKLGQAYLLAGNQQEALAQYQAALEIDQQLGNAPGAIVSLRSLGNIYAGQRQYQAAIDSYQYALAVAQQGADRALDAEFWTALGRSYAALEDYQQAVNHYQRGIEVANQNGYYLWEIRARLGLGETQVILSNYQAAIEAYQGISSLTWRVRDDDSRSEVNDASVLASLGLADIYALQGQYQQATTYINEVNNGWTIGFGNYIPLQAEISQRLGDVYFNLGQYQQAIDAYERAIDVAKQNSNRRVEAASLAGLSNTYSSLGQVEQADRYRQDAGVIYAELGLPSPLENALARSQATGNRAGEVRALVSQGNEALAKGDHAQALSDYQAGLGIAREIGIRREESLALVGLGDTYQGLGDTVQALDAYQQGLAVAREIGVREVEARALNSLGWLHLNQGAVAEAETLFGEAVAVFDSLRDTVQADASKVSLFDRQVGAYRGLEQVYVLQNRPDAALEAAEQGRARAFIDMLAQNLSQQQQAPFTATPPDVAAIQAIARTERSVLVEYSLMETGPDSPSLYIWVVQPSGQIDFRKVSLTASTADLAQLVSASREAMGVRGRGFELALNEPTTADNNGQLRQLHQLLIDPIADLLPANPRDRVVFIPQGPLFLVPFAALQNEAGQYLIERHTILTAPSIQALALSREQRAPRRIGSTYTPQKLLLVGNPTMPSVWNPNTGQRSPLGALPGSESEVMEIANTYRATALVGDRATEAVVKQRMGDAMVVHLATHGLLEYEDPQLAGGQGVPGAIALAPGDGEDGLLTSTEILEDLKLSAEIVVLSACDTGRGEITGDGVIGLSRSLMAAGAPTVIVSLWSVPDAPTAQLMTAFYRHLLLEETRDQALRQAMLETMQTHPNPVDWAAFTFMGLGE